MPFGGVGLWTLTFGSYTGSTACASLFRNLEQRRDSVGVRKIEAALLGR